MENKEMEILVSRLEESNNQLQETIIKTHNKKINFIIGCLLTFFAFSCIPTAYLMNSKQADTIAMFLSFFGVMFLFITLTTNHLEVPKFTSIEENSKQDLPDNVIPYE